MTDQNPTPAPEKPDVIPVLVTTEHRGVFFGYLAGEATKERLTLRKARNCLHWTSATGGFLGLAEVGPRDGCRVGRVAEEVTLFDITSVAACTPAAVEAWEAAKWSR